MNAGSGVNDYSRGLVDHGQKIVFVNDLERYIFRLEACGGFVGKFDIDLIAGAEDRLGDAR